MEVIDIRTNLHACSIERLHRDFLFACGTYELHEGENVRAGEIVVVSQSTIVHTMQCESGVLDMTYCAGKLCVALSHGALSIYCIGGTDELDSEKLLFEITNAQPEEGLFLSLDVNLRNSERCWKDATSIVVSTQSGSVLVFQYAPEAASLVLTHRKPSAHTMMKQDMPAWITFFNPHNSSRIVSGGDDCMMKLWRTAVADSTDENEEPSGLEAVATNRNTHSAGVTSGQWHPVHADIYATGSYDEHVRVWSCCQPSAPLLEIHTGTCYAVLP
jgi:WD40 repeat protein